MTTAVTQNGPRVPTGVAANARHAVLWLAHPVTVVAFIVLALNDHVFKAAYGTWWTGKLSDAAGMAAFPALLTLAFSWVAPRVSPPARVTAAVITTGVGFVWVKATAVGAATASSALSLAVPSLVRQDATDLLALPFLVLAGWIGMRVATVRPTARPGLKWLLVIPAVVVCTATSSGVEYNGAQEFFVHDGTVYVEVQTYPVQYVAVKPGGRWERLSEEASARLATAKLEDASRCTSGEPMLCFRPALGTIGVDVSRDNGATWEPEWELSDFEFQYIVDHIGSGPSTTRTVDVAVVESGSGVMVVASNGQDGFAIRNSDGTWERVGFTPYSDSPYAPPVQVPAEGSAPIYFGVPLTFAYMAPALTLGLPVLAGVLRIRAQRRHNIGGRNVAEWIGAGLLTAIATAATGLFALSAHNLRSYNSHMDNFFVMLELGGLAIWFGGSLIPTAVAVSIVAHRRAEMVLLTLGICGAGTTAAILIDTLWSHSYGSISTALGVTGALVAISFLPAGIKKHRAHRADRTMRG